MTARYLNFNGVIVVERTFVMCKPDCVQRGLVGESIRRFEQAGLKIIALKMVKPSKELVQKHYPSTEEWYRTVGQKTLKSYKEYGLDAKKDLGTDVDLEIGKIVKGWLVDFISSAPVVAMVIEGNHAIDNVRRLVGNTLPILAAAGTIRGDFSIDSPDLANVKQRPVRNIIHASGSREEADNEVSLWFRKEEMHSYKRADEEVMFG
jgi:nucleoside-diphosphate kinase